MLKLDLEKAEEPEIKLPTSTGSSKKQESSRKTSTSTLLTMPKPLNVWITTNWKILKEMEIPDHLTCLLRNLYGAQEATVRTGHGTTDWFQIRKVVRQGCILSPCLFNLYAEYIMRNTGLDEAQAGIKIARRNIHNFPGGSDSKVSAWTVGDPGLGWEDHLEKEMANHSRTLALKIPWMEEPGGLQSMGSQTQTRLSDFTFTQICRLYHPYGRKQRTKEPLDESERGEWKNWLKVQHSEN